MALMGAVITFVFVTSVIMLVDMLARGVPVTASSRLQSIMPESLPGEGASTGDADRLPTLTRMLSAHNFAAHLQTEISAAGLMLRPSEYIGITICSVLVLQLIPMFLIRNITATIGFAIIGIALPYMVLKSLQSRRKNTFDKQLVGSLTMIASSLRSGFSLMRSMQMVSQEMPPPISVEFERVINEVNIGRPMEDALRESVSRVKSYDYDLMVTAILINQQVGGNLSEILDIIAHTIRERLQIRGEMRALTAEGRLSGVILVILPLALAGVIALLNPPYLMTLITEPIGIYLIVAAVMLQIVGGFFIKKILTIDV
jgi:tight adherence protein B